MQPFEKHSPVAKQSIVSIAFAGRAWPTVATSKFAGCDAGRRRNEAAEKGHRNDFCTRLRHPETMDFEARFANEHCKTHKH